MERNKLQESLQRGRESLSRLARWIIDQVAIYPSDFNARLAASPVATEIAAARRGEGTRSEDEILNGLPPQVQKYALMTADRTRPLDQTEAGISARRLEERSRRLAEAQHRLRGPQGLRLDRGE
ncbi:hypothetical protein HYW36_02590 [Candidatus Saccharibacteria bacterium]|nr:hypothetical protein [Candidatus Saccharibacteria bacterium]